MPLDRKLTEEDARSALRGHVTGKAYEAVERYGKRIDRATFEAMLQDPEVSRWPARIAFDNDALRPGEFGFAAPDLDSPDGAWVITLHPRYRNDDDAVVTLAAYHVVSINYGEIASHEEAEVFGAILLGLDPDEYYEKVCTLADREE